MGFTLETPVSTILFSKFLFIYFSLKYLLQFPLLLFLSPLDIPTLYLPSEKNKPLRDTN